MRSFCFRYRSLTPLYYRGASIILVVYDITNEESMKKGVREWVHELRVNGPDDSVLVVVGNKLDMESALREVGENEAREYAEKIGALFFEASAKTGENVMKLFLTACSHLNKDKAIAYVSTSNGVKKTSASSKTTWYRSTSSDANNGKNNVEVGKPVTVEHNDIDHKKSCCAT